MKNKRPQRKIKILSVITRMNVGGVSVHVKNLTEHLNPKKFTTRLITGKVSIGEGDMDYISSLKDDQKIVIPELQREISPYHDLKALFKIIKIIKRYNPDIIDSHTSKAGAISRIAAFVINVFRSHNIITVHTFHGNILVGYFGSAKSFFFLNVEKVLAKVTNMIIALSHSQKWELVNKYKIGRSRQIHTIKLGFDLVPFQSTGKKKGYFKNKFDIQNDTLLIGIVGRMVPIKNHRLFLEAGKLLIQNQIKREIKLILIGDGDDRCHLELLANQLGIRDHALFTGWKKNIPEIFADLDILALTSFNEGTPVSVIEALAAGVPVVSTDVGGIKDLLGKIQPGQFKSRSFHVCERGILCSKNDPEALADALNFMLNSGYLYQRHRFDAAQHYVINHYSIERLLNEVESLYLDLIDKRDGYPVLK